MKSPPSSVFGRAGASARPAPAANAFSHPIRAACRLTLRLIGWRLSGDWPEGVAKAVLLAAPHTANRDGVLMLLAAGAYRVKLRWMGKKSLTKGPFGPVVRWLGCVPVDRSAAQNLVKQMGAAFAAEPRLVLAIAPEGTRRLNPTWKRGYYHIAHDAQAPIVVSVLDYGAKTISLPAVIWPSGDYDADFALISRLYEGVRAKRPDQFTTGPAGP